MMADKIYEDGGLITKRFTRECPFSGDCSDGSTDRCRYCKNNRKRSYFEPRDEPPQTPYWRNPYWHNPYWPDRTTGKDMLWYY